MGAYKDKNGTWYAQFRFTNWKGEPDRKTKRGLSVARYALHISLLIDMGFSAVAIADRVGHESIDITYRYAHVFPSTQTEVVSKLNNMMICSDSIEEQQIGT